MSISDEEIAHKYLLTFDKHYEFAYIIKEGTEPKYSYIGKLFNIKNFGFNYCYMTMAYFVDDEGNVKSIYLNDTGITFKEV